ncbi:MAG: hypothetical protein PVS2B2_28380 [Candidatus Acidiferrum sp.]
MSNESMVGDQSDAAGMRLQRTILSFVTISPKKRFFLQCEPIFMYKSLNFNIANANIDPAELKSGSRAAISVLE